MLPPCVGMMSVSTALTSAADRPRVGRQRRDRERVRREHDERRLPCRAPLEQIEQLELRAREPRRLDVARHPSSATSRARRRAPRRNETRAPAGAPTRARERDDGEQPSGERRAATRDGCRAALGLGEHVRPQGSARRSRASRRRRRGRAAICQISQAPTGSEQQPERAQEMELSHGRARLASALSARATTASASAANPTSAAAEREHDRCAERPVEELGDRPEAALVGLGGLERVQDLVDLGELRRVARAEVSAARHLGDRRQRLLVEVRRRIDLAQAEQRAHRQRIGADADRVDDQLALRRELGRLARLDGAGRVGAVGQQQAARAGPARRRRPRACGSRGRSSRRSPSPCPRARSRTRRAAC